MEPEYIDFNDPSWEVDAACRDNPLLFFGPEGERVVERQMREAKALAICSGCIVMDLCRARALDREEQYGVLGGMTEKDREDLLKRQKRNW